jgi:Rrf2 family iron-sulfur cluster assembly transcriptional regulator
MKISTKARYAITAMMDLALHENAKPVTLSDISQYQGISLSYLEQLFAKLRAGDLVRGVRGPGGGYRLSRPAREISIAAIVTAINDKDEIIFKEANTSRRDVLGERDKLAGMWSNLSGKIFDFLDGVTLHDFVAEAMQGESGSSIVDKILSDKAITEKHSAMA